MRGARGPHREVFRVEARQAGDDGRSEPGDGAPHQPGLDADGPREPWEGEEIARRGRREDRGFGASRGTGRARRGAVGLGSLAALAIVLSIERPSTSTVPAREPVEPGPVSHGAVVPGPVVGSATVSSPRAGARRRFARVSAAGRSSASARPAYVRRSIPTPPTAPAPVRVQRAAASPALSEFGFER